MFCTYRFTSCNLDSFCFRIGDFKLPNSIYSSSGNFTFILAMIKLFIFFMKFTVWYISYYFSEYMRIHSTSQALSPQDKWFYQNFLRSLCLDPYFNQYPRFSYNNILFNGSFFISVSMLPHGQSQFDFEYTETAHFPNLVRIFLYVLHNQWHHAFIFVFSLHN